MAGMSRDAASPQEGIEAISGSKRGGSHLGRKEKGQALVEFSVVLSFLLVPLVVGMATFAIFLSNYLTLTDAVNLGARQLAISRNVTTDPCTLVSTAITKAYQAGAVETGTPQLSITISMDNNSQSYPGTNIFACSGTSTSGGPSYLVQNSYATITVTHQIQPIFSSFGNFNIQARTTELVQ
jgi:Flp pilus assembly protein TadG